MRATNSRSIRWLAWAGSCLSCRRGRRSQFCEATEGGGRSLYIGRVAGYGEFYWRVGSRTPPAGRRRGQSKKSYCTVLAPSLCDCHPWLIRITTTAEYAASSHKSVVVSKTVAQRLQLTRSIADVKVQWSPKKTWPRNISDDARGYC